MSRSARTMRVALAVVAVSATILTPYRFWLTPAAASADPSPVIRVGLYQNPPKIYRDNAGKPAGLFVTLLRAIAREEHWQLQFVDCKWQDCLQRLASARLDLMPDMAYSAARGDSYAFHRIPVAHSWSVLLSRKDHPLVSLPELDHRRIALLAGSVQVKPFAAIMNGLGLQYTPITYPSFDAAFAAVHQGDADAVVSNRFYAALNADRYDLQESPIVFQPVALYYAATAGDPLDLLGAIDTHLRRWRYQPNSVYYAALRAAMVPTQEPVLPPGFQYAAVAAIGLVLLFLIISAVLRRQVRRKTTQLHESDQRLAHLVNSSAVVLYQLSMDGYRVHPRWVSDNVRRLFGYPPEQFVAEAPWPHLVHPDDREMVLNNLAVLRETGHLVQEYRIRDAAGDIRFVRDEMQLLSGPADQPDEVVGAWNDLTESHAQAAQLSFLTHYDPLTRLPNRALLRERVTHAIYRARRERRPLAVLVADVDRFKMINDSLGQTVGDGVLKALADRLSRILRVGDILARVGGDGFVMLMEESAGRPEAVAMARQAMARLVEPIRIAEQEVGLTFSTGIALFPDHGDDTDSLLQNAEAAMYEAKRSGRNTYRIYSSSLSAGAGERLSIAGALRSAAGNGELLLHYQPQLELASRRLVGVEALVRWLHPQLGLVSPARFIPVAEEMGVIGDIGAWVLEEACRQMLAWRAEGLTVPRVAVNLSVQQIDGDTLIPLVRRILDRTGLDAPSLELEVTESIIMREPEKATTALEGLRAMGIQLAIDDFGTGYSSLNYLKHLPINRLKIDQSFVRDIGSDLNSEAISRAIIGLARSLELETVAEGVEHERQQRFLSAEGCAVGQGYLFSRPVPGIQLAEVCRTLVQT